MNIEEIGTDIRYCLPFVRAIGVVNVKFDSL